MKKKFLTTTIIAGAAAAAGAVIYKMTKDSKNFSCDRWDVDIKKRYKMADSLIRSDALSGKTKKDVLSILGVNGLKSNTASSMEYFLSEDEENPKLLIIEFDENEVVTNVTACV